MIGFCFLGLLGVIVAVCLVRWVPPLQLSDFSRTCSRRTQVRLGVSFAFCLVRWVPCDFLIFLRTCPRCTHVRPVVTRCMQTNGEGGYSLCQGPIYPYCPSYSYPSYSHPLGRSYFLNRSYGPRSSNKSYSVGRCSAPGSCTYPCIGCCCSVTPCPFEKAR